MAAEFAQVVFAHLADVDTVVEDFADGRLDQPVDVADERRLAGAGEAHDDGDGTGRHVDADVLQTEHMPVRFVELGLAHAVFDLLDIVASAAAKNLVEVLYLDRVTSHE